MRKHKGKPNSPCWGKRGETENKLPDKHDFLKGQQNQFALGESQFKEYRHSLEFSEKPVGVESKELMSF